jgi:hypothetical protein
MHKVRGNYNSCTGRSSENICGSSGGAQEKGNRGQNRMKLQFSIKNGCISEFHQKIYVATVEVLRKMERGEKIEMKLSVLVLCFPDFTENSNSQMEWHPSINNDLVAFSTYACAVSDDQAHK